MVTAMTESKNGTADVTLTQDGGFTTIADIPEYLTEDSTWTSVVMAGSKGIKITVTVTPEGTVSYK